MLKAQIWKKYIIILSAVLAVLLALVIFLVINLILKANKPAVSKEEIPVLEIIRIESFLEKIEKIKK